MDISLAILGIEIERAGREDDVDLFGCSLVHIHIHIQVSFMGVFLGELNEIC